MAEGAAPSFRHDPVLVPAALEWLGPALQSTDVLVDCTVGGGGHAEAFLQTFDRLTVIGIDRDEQALEAARARLESFGARVKLAKGNFLDLDEVVDSMGHAQVGAVLYDLGVSSAQLDRPERGFSYRSGSSLDMRMDQSSSLTAADIVNGYSVQELGRVLFEYGEERYARRIARAIVSRRASKTFQDAADLADVVRGSIPAASRRAGPHPARRTFQALRIEVNDELGSLSGSLDLAVSRLRAGGRLAVISYHSLEDRIVKRFFRQSAAECTCPKDFPVCVCGARPQLKVLTGKPVRPDAQEVERNPRSDSARLRVAEKLEEVA
ncbi:MAG: 16S rRNA (cytosine(1402)-N(4))-methyltransferase RsmH [Actinomycetota bacterium]